MEQGKGGTGQSYRRHSKSCGEQETHAVLDITSPQPLLLLHSFRFIGLAFLVPGVVSPDLPAAFAKSAAYGDVIAATLALLSLLLLKRRAGVVVVWIFSLWGTFDLLNAFYEANRTGLLAGQLGAMYFVPTVIVPLLLITHGLVFRILLQRQGEHSMRQSRHPA